MNISNVPNSNNSTKSGAYYSSEKESLGILKHCCNEFKIDISFFTKLHEYKINVYKLKSDYVNLCSKTYVNKIKIGHNYKKDINYNIINFEYPYVNVSTIEINKKSFIENKKDIKEEDLQQDKKNNKIPNEENNNDTYYTKNVCYNEEYKNKKKNINRYTKNYMGILLNFNTLEEFFNTQRNNHVNYSLNDLKSYLNESSCINLGNEKNKKENIYEDSFWEYKENELNFLEKINKYIILSYLDLKKCICYYSIANPVIKPKVDYHLINYERIFFYIDSERVYLNNDRRKINVIDLFYLSYKIDNYFNNYKMFIESNAFILLKFDNKPLQNLNIKEYYEKYLDNIFNNFQIDEEEEIIYKINTFKELFEYLKRNVDNSNNNILHKNYDILVLPLNCLNELKQDIKNSKDKKLKNIKKNMFDLYLCFIDINCIHNTLSWDFRNFLYCFCVKYELYDFEIDIFAFRDISLLTDQFVCTLNSNNKLVWKYPICNTKNDIMNNSDTSFSYVSNIYKVDYDVIKDNIHKINEYIKVEKDNISYENGKNKNKEVIDTNISNYTCVNEEENDKPYTTNNKNNRDMEKENSNNNNTMIKYILNSSIFKVKISENFHFKINRETDTIHEHKESSYNEKINEPINNLMDNKKLYLYDSQKENNEEMNKNKNILSSNYISSFSNKYCNRKNDFDSGNDKYSLFDQCEKRYSLKNPSFLHNLDDKDNNLKDNLINRKNSYLSDNSEKRTNSKDNKIKKNKCICIQIHSNLKYEIISGWKKYEKKKNGLKKQSIINIINLNDFLNKNVIHRISVELNIKLIKWKILKDLKFEKIKKLKVMIIGLGTLGCMVARNCVSWGIQNFTFVDNSRVSFSNVSRQYLYTIEDAERYNNIGEYKSIAAKNNLLKITPDLNITAKIMDIPMPGHLNYLKEDIENTMNELDELIDNHDVIFLLTDSKESRYFPCLLIAEKQYNCLNEIKKSLREGTKKNALYKNNSDMLYTDDFTYEYMNINEKNLLEENDFNRYLFYNNIIANVEKLPKLPPLGITVAIGFDSFLVLRHSFLYFRAACYFCNDMHSPSDSLTNRTLDEKCTVTRSGISNISSSIAVELLVSLTQHPLYFFAPHIDRDQYIYSNDNNYEIKKETKKNELSNSLSSCLGATPHILTFNLSNFSIKKLFSDAFDRCLCCSENVILNYKENKMAFIKNVINDSLILERITNITKLKVEENDVIMLD
ncbi:autophagy-related protein 7, putative [Plasmodium gallinaceum]|uniref:Autophagy-related protein 7, putative n=1 Tax=Plasmodium gallinaceum TaxID=5849 RepID=A0A1J1GVN1_PLAGA|nr:autophagy-related protein 7, putative [Plasmodium gallinaceum]CRG96310.1 autophagy-related protein 7, putative [Plasmodium gallinaceum]